MDFTKVVELLKALEREEVEYIVVGGVALNIQGITRATQDIDLFLEPSEGNIERLKRALRTVWADPEIDTISTADFEGECPNVQYVPPDSKVSLDLLTRLGDAFRYEDLLWERKEWSGVRVRIATAQMLYEMKKDTLRLQDKADAAELRERFGLKE